MTVEQIGGIGGLVGGGNMRLEVAHCAGQDYHPAQLIYWLSYTRAAQLVRLNKEIS